MFLIAVTLLLSLTLKLQVTATTHSTVAEMYYHFGFQTPNTGRVSLITGLEYGTERWNEKWNGIVNIHNCS